MTLEVKIFSRGLEITDQIDEYVTNKVSKLNKFLDDITEARVDLASTKVKNADEREVAQITVQGKGFILRAEERAGDILTAVNLSLETIKRRIKRYKGKRNERWKREREKNGLEHIYVEEEAEEPLIARRKKFGISPMDEWEAIEQMELLGHDSFFIFFNAHTGSINVLYKRYDDTYGLIEPELG